MVKILDIQKFVSSIYCLSFFLMLHKEVFYLRVVLSVYCFLSASPCLEYLFVSFKRFYFTYLFKLNF